MAGAGCLLNGCPKLGVAQGNVTSEGAVGSDVFDRILMQKSVGEIVGRYDEDDDGCGDEATEPELERERVLQRSSEWNVKRHTSPSPTRSIFRKMVFARSRMACL